MRRFVFAVAILLSISASVRGFDFIVQEDADHAFPVILVDETDGYTREAEKKAADTTITYCNIEDGNTVSTYTDDDTLWDEVGNGTGNYKLVIGASEFTDPGKRYLVEVVVSGCRAYCFSVFTTTGNPATPSVNVTQWGGSATPVTRMGAIYDANWATAWDETNDRWNATAEATVTGTVD